MKFIRFLAMMAFLILVMSGFLASETEQRYLTIGDLFKLKRVSNPQISPEGDWLAFTISETDLEKDKSETRIWMMPTAGGDPIPMTGKDLSAGSPRWSPDGKYLSFSASRNEGKSQVWILDRRGGEAWSLTDIKQGISGFVWSPDGKKLLLSIRDPGKMPNSGNSCLRLTAWKKSSHPL